MDFPYFSFPNQWMISKLEVKNAISDAIFLERKNVPFTMMLRINAIELERSLCTRTVLTKWAEN